MGARHLLLAVPVAAAIGIGLGAGWLLDQRLKETPPSPPVATVEQPRASGGPVATQPPARQEVDSPTESPVAPPLDAGGNDLVMAAQAEKDVNAEAVAEPADLPALAHDARDRAVPKLASRLSAPADEETATGERAPAGQDAPSRPDQDQDASAALRDAGGDSATPPTPPAARPARTAPSAAATADPSAGPEGPRDEATAGSMPALKDPVPGERADPAQPDAPPEAERTQQAAAPTDIREAPAEGAAESSEQPNERAPPETVPAAGATAPLATAADDATADGESTEKAAGEMAATPEGTGEEAAPGFSFDLRALGERIARLFGRDHDLPDQETVEAAVAAAKSSRDENPGDSPRRSLSEDSVRQAVRAAVASDPELEEPRGSGAKPGAGPGEPETGPSFDIVRLERDGSAVIAGRAGPGTEVEVRAGETVIDRVTADRRGNWVSIPPDKLAAGEHILSLVSVADESPAQESSGVVVIRVPGLLPPQPAEVRLAEGPPPQPAATAERRPAQEEPLAILPAVSTNEPLAVLLPRDGGGTGRILQAPGRIQSDGELALLVLDYDQAGRVQLAGEGPAGAPIQIYVDNEPAGKVVVAQDGTWRTQLNAQLGAGTYTLRLDQLDPDGSPTARLETPFTRVDKPPREGAVNVDYVVVQPGNSLWRIARRLSGEGMRYVHIFESNRGQIRDPDLIYPGQVFQVPPSFGSAG